MVGFDSQSVCPCGYQLSGGAEHINSKFQIFHHNNYYSHPHNLATTAMQKYSQNGSQRPSNTPSTPSPRLLDKMLSLVPLVDDLVARKGSLSENLLSGLTKLQKGIGQVFEQVRRDFQKLQAQNIRLKQQRSRTRQRDQSTDFQNLTQQMEDLRSHSNRLREENRSLSQALSQMELTNRNMRIQSGQSAANGGLEAVLAGLKGELQAEKARNKQIQQYYQAQLRTKEEEIKHRLEGAEAEHTRLQKKVRFNQQKLCQYYQKISELQQKNSKITLEQQKSTLGLQSTLKTSADEMSRVLRSGGGGSGSFVQEFKTQSEERWKESTGKLNDEIRELKRKLGSSEGEVERLRQEVERSRGELERERKKGAGEVRRLQTLLDERSSKFQSQLRQAKSELQLQRRNNTSKPTQSSNDDLKLQLQLRQLQRQLDDKSYQIRKLQSQLQQKQRQLQTKKTTTINSHSDDKLKSLQDQIERQKKRAVADQIKIRKLQAERDESKKNQVVRKLQAEIALLKKTMDDQRRKSMADVDIIVNLEHLLQEKIEQAQDAQSHFEKQLEELQQEIDCERRKSMADQARIRKMEELLKEKSKMVENSDNIRGRRNSYKDAQLSEQQMRMLKDVIGGEISPSLSSSHRIPGEQRVRQLQRSVSQLQKQLKQKQKLISELKSQLSEKQSTIKDLERKLASRPEDQSRVLRDLQNSIEKLEKEMCVVKAENIILRKKDLRGDYNKENSSREQAISNEDKEKMLRVLKGGLGL